MSSQACIVAGGCEVAQNKANLGRECGVRNELAERMNGSAKTKPIFGEDGRLEAVGLRRLRG